MALEQVQTIRLATFILDLVAKRKVEEDHDMPNINSAPSQLPPTVVMKLDIQGKRALCVTFSFATVFS